jgi:hypothetical protein
VATTVSSSKLNKRLVVSRCKVVMSAMQAAPVQVMHPTDSSRNLVPANGDVTALRNIVLPIDDTDVGGLSPMSMSLPRLSEPFSE